MKHSPEAKGWMEWSLLGFASLKACWGSTWGLRKCGVLKTKTQTDIQIKGLSLAEWRQNILLCQRDSSEQRQGSGNHRHRWASQPSVFVLALRNEKCQKGEDERKKPNKNQRPKRKSNAETVRVVRMRFCYSWNLNAKLAQSWTHG